MWRVCFECNGLMLCNSDYLRWLRREWKVPGKETSERTAKKVENVNKWFGKLDKDLTDFLAYFA